MTRNQYVLSLARCFITGTRVPGLGEIYCTNVCKCRSYDKGNTGLSEATRRCTPYLGYEIQLLRPKAIVTFGRRAISVVAAITGLNVPTLSMKDLHCRDFMNANTRQRTLVLQHWGRRKGSQYYREIRTAFTRLAGTLESR